MLICPICKNKLVLKGKSYVCDNGHLFDLSKKGYVNLMVGSSSKRHGDDKIMANARKSFLNTGSYKPLLEKIYSLCLDAKAIIDIGCGECYYSEGLYNLFDNKPKIISFDISKEIIEVAYSRVKNTNIITVVAGCNKIPVPDNSVDVAISIFAPITDSEIIRVLKNDGKLIRVTPGKQHLFELKNVVYI